VKINFKLIEFGESREPCVILIMQDLTESEKLREVSNMKGYHRKMVSSITNNMNVPLQTINEGINILCTGEKDASRLEILKHCSKSINIIRS